MNTLFKFLTENSGALSILFSTAVTVATIVYTFPTRMLAKENRLLQETKTEPRIEINAQTF